MMEANNKTYIWSTYRRHSRDFKTEDFLYPTRTMSKEVDENWSVYDVLWVDKLIFSLWDSLTKKNTISK